MSRLGELSKKRIDGVKLVKRKESKRDAIFSHYFFGEGRGNEPGQLASLWCHLRIR